jgi:hypothetical protein
VTRPPVSVPTPLPAPIQTVPGWQGGDENIVYEENNYYLNDYDYYNVYVSNEYSPSTEFYSIGGYGVSTDDYARQPDYSYYEEANRSNEEDKYGYGCGDGGRRNPNGNCTGQNGFRRASRNISAGSGNSRPMGNGGQNPCNNPCDNRSVTPCNTPGSSSRNTPRNSRCGDQYNNSCSNNSCGMCNNPCSGPNNDSPCPYRERPNNAGYGNGVMTGKTMPGYIPPMDDSYGCAETNQLHDDMRRAWAKHVYGTRMLIISIAGRLDDLSAVKTELMQNPQEIAKIYIPYFSEKTANGIAVLMTEHLQIGADLITASRDKQSDKAKELDKKWHNNGTNIVEALYAMNPNYDKKELQKMWDQHLELTAKEAAARLAKNYPEDIKAYNRVARAAENMADYLAEGIVQ